MPELNKFSARGSFTSNVVIIFAAQIISRNTSHKPKSFQILYTQKGSTRIKTAD